MTALAFGIVDPLKQWLGDDGLPLANGRVLTYAAGTTTPLLTYKDALLTVPNSPTVLLDSEGKAVIYLQVLAYKIDVQDSTGVSIDGYPQDGIRGLPTSVLTAASPGTAGQVLTSNGALADPSFQTLLGLLPVTIKPTVVTLADGATPALDASLGTIFVLVAAGNRTIAVPTNPTDGQKIVIRQQASGGARTLALNSAAGGFRFGTDISALSSTTSGKWDYIGCIYNGTDSKWDVVAYTKGF